MYGLSAKPVNATWMLAADKAAMLADTAHNALALRKLEFDYLALRYTTLGGLSSILTGFA